MKAVITFIIMLGICGCSAGKVGSFNHLESNRHNLESLSLRMSKDEVMKIMGSSVVCDKCSRIKNRVVQNPYRTEKKIVQVNGPKEWEILYFVTYFNEGDWPGVDRHTLVPLTFDENGKLINIGELEL